MWYAVPGGCVTKKQVYIGPERRALRNTKLDLLDILRLKPSGVLNSECSRELKKLIQRSN